MVKYVWNELSYSLNQDYSSSETLKIVVGKHGQCYTHCQHYHLKLAISR